MTVSEDQLTHEEVWDDSALIDSWNEALDEYKKYHSIHAKGGKLADLEPRASTTSKILKTLQSETREGDQPAEADLPPGGVEETHEVTPGTAPPTATVSESRDTTGDATAMAPPQVLLSTVQDEGLKKLLMSWYYAGYYTGLYEGQQRQRTQPSAP
ncbi:Survival motor neuron-like protein 1 like [Verticillium longisporum]|nr:Survival motor neuron-like protein 1 like [Verticillium longisporum]